jgi:hypothetical protein
MLAGEFIGSISDLLNNADCKLRDCFREDCSDLRQWFNWTVQLNAI